MAARGEPPVKVRKDVAYAEKLAKGAKGPSEEVVGNGKLVNRDGKVLFWRFPLPCTVSCRSEFCALRVSF